MGDLVVKRWLNNRSMRVKVLTPVLISAFGLGVVGMIAVVALGHAGDRTRSMFAHTARPLADLVAMRDAQGDGRVAVRDAIITLPGPAQEDVIAAMRDADQALDQALAAYAADWGTLDGTRAGLLTRARAGIGQWRRVRDDQLVPLVRTGNTRRAAALLADGGGLDRANGVFGDALDTLTGRETADANRVAALAETAQRRDRNLLIIIALIGVAAAVAVGLLVAALVVQPLRRVQRVLARLAAGDLGGDPLVASRDEVGSMASALVAANASLSGTVGTVIDSTHTLDQAAEQLHDSSGRIAERLSGSASQAATVAEAAGAASNSITTVTAGADEMSAAIREIAERASQAAAVAGDAVQVVSTTSATVAELARNSGDIEQVLRVITAIAEQTNLLALNATIEAARAGETGKGFAVVAGEVKELAQQTATATEDIARRVSAIQGSSSEAIAAIERIGAVINEINDHQGAIAAAVEEQTATTAEMQRNVAEAAVASTRIATTIADVAEAASTAEAEAQASRQSISAIRTIADDLRRTIDHFQR